MSQGVHLRKYGVQATIPFELYEVDGVDLRTDWTPAVSDCKIEKNAGGYTQCSNTASGTTTYRIVLTATEMQFARGVLKIVDAATKAFLDKVVIIETYGHASAQHAADLSIPPSALSSVTPAGYVGDFKLNETLHFAFSTSAPISAQGNAIRVFKDDSDTPLSTAGATLDVDIAGEANMNQVTIVFSPANYDPDSDYHAVLSGATIGGNVITAVVATFSIQNRYQKPVHRQVAE